MTGEGGMVSYWNRMREWMNKKTELTKYTRPVQQSYSTGKHIK